MCSHTVDVLLKTEYGSFLLCAGCAGVGPLPAAGDLALTGHMPGVITRRANYIERERTCECEHIAHCQ
jgi:hypothetical protein